MLKPIFNANKAKERARLITAPFKFWQELNAKIEAATAAGKDDCFMYVSDPELIVIKAFQPVTSPIFESELSKLKEDGYFYETQVVQWHSQIFFKLTVYWNKQ